MQHKYVCLHHVIPNMPYHYHACVLRWQGSSARCPATCAASLCTRRQRCTRMLASSRVSLATTSAADSASTPPSAALTASGCRASTTAQVPQTINTQSFVSSSYYRYLKDMTISYVQVHVNDALLVVAARECEHEGESYHIGYVYRAPQHCEDGAYTATGFPMIEATCLPGGVWSTPIDTCQGMSV